jgi:hypothetical protein
MMMMMMMTTTTIMMVVVAAMVWAYIWMKFATGYKQSSLSKSPLPKCVAKYDVSGLSTQLPVAQAEWILTRFSNEGFHTNER